MNFSEDFLKEVVDVSNSISTDEVEFAVSILENTQFYEGTLFIIGNGGSHASASHAVNDFRKICKINAFTPFDNASEMTAYINDDGWENSTAKWMELFDPGEFDTMIVLSVGGGSEEKNVSMNIVNAIKYAKECGVSIISIVGKKEFAHKKSDVSIFIPTSMPTPIVESFHSLINHLFVSHPSLKQNQTKWESLE